MKAEVEQCSGIESVLKMRKPNNKSRVFEMELLKQRSKPQINLQTLEEKK